MRGAAAVAGFVALLALAGCGGSSSSSAVPPAPEGSTTPASAVPSIETAPAPSCPVFAPLPLAVPVGKEDLWSACDNQAATMMVLTNVSAAVLLMAPQGSTILSRYGSPVLSADEDSIATLSVEDAPTPADPQLALLPAGAIYVPPGGQVTAQRGLVVPFAVDVDVSPLGSVQYAVSTALTRWMLARVSPGYAALKTLQEVRECIDGIPNSYAAAYSGTEDGGTVVKDAIGGTAGCYSVYKAFATTDDEAVAGGEADGAGDAVMDVARDSVKEVPAAVWDWVGDLAEQVLEHVR